MQWAKIISWRIIIKRWKDLLRELLLIRSIWAANKHIAIKNRRIHFKVERGLLSWAATNEWKNKC